MIDDLTQAYMIYNGSAFDNSVDLLESKLYYPIDVEKVVFKKLAFDVLSEDAKEIISGIIGEEAKRIAPHLGEYTVKDPSKFRKVRMRHIEKYYRRKWRKRKAVKLAIEEVRKFVRDLLH